MIDGNELPDPADFDYQAQQLARRRKIAEQLMASPVQSPTIRAGGRDIVNWLGPVNRLMEQTQGNREGERLDAADSALQASQKRVTKSFMDQQPEAVQKLAPGLQVPGLRQTIAAQIGNEMEAPARAQAAEAARIAKREDLAINLSAQAEQKEADRQNRLALRQMPTQHITITGGGRAGAGGPDGFGGAAPVIGSDEQGAPIYRHTKSGQLFQFDEQGQPAPYRGAVGAKPAPDKPLTDSQAKDVIYGTRAAQAQNILDEVGMTYSPIKLDMARGAERIPGGRAAANSFVLGASEQKIDQAQRNFINAVLRRESGAVISPEEFNNARKQYFPEPGDQPATLEQKRKNRDLVISGLATGAGTKGAKEVEKERANKSPEARAMVGSKAEFDALPAGAKWQTADGRKGTK